MVLKNKKFFWIGTKGITLVELLVCVSILAILILILTTTLNPIAMMNRGNDARRKKDLNKIKTAFEEYLNDKGHYPDAALVDQLMQRSNCGSNVMAPWLNTWPCDPISGEPYKILTDSPEALKWYKVFTNLENKTDSDVPSGWYHLPDTYHMGEMTALDVNYGVSSTNVNWYDPFIDGNCTYHPLDHTQDVCNFYQDGSCKGASNNACSGSNCYASPSCDKKCKVACCEAGCN